MSNSSDTKSPLATRMRAVRVVGPVLMLLVLCATVALAVGWQARSADEAPARSENYSKTKTGRPDPFGGLPGCVQLAGDAVPTAWAIRPGSSAACTALLGTNTAVVELDFDDAPRVPREIVATVSGPRPAYGLKSALHGTKLVSKNGFTVATGPDAAVTLSSSRQAAAQQWLDCATDGELACPNGAEPPAWAQRYEGAAARMVGLAEIDIATGGVLAVAGAASPCYANHWADEPLPKDAECPSLPARGKAQPGRLDHQGVYHSTMPGSITKPVLALALMRAKGGQRYLGGKDRQWLVDVLRASDSKLLLAKVLCKDQGFPSDCDTLNHLHQAAIDLGAWTSAPDLLTTSIAVSAESARVPTPAPRMFADMRQGGKAMALPMPDAQSLKDCAATEFRKCKGADTARLLSELWGQGDSSMTPLAAAHMAARLGAAANAGARQIAPLHLLVTHGGKDVRVPAQRVLIEAEQAKVILAGMTAAVQRGTAAAACAQVYTQAECRRMDHIAMKTGTPAFTQETMSDEDRADYCDEVSEEIAERKSAVLPVPTALLTNRARCSMAPYKWTIALEKDSGGRYTRAIAVLAERNYNKATGAIDSRGDTGVNVAAEIALRYIRSTQQ